MSNWPVGMCREFDASIIEFSVSVFDSVELRRALRTLAERNRLGGLKNRIFHYFLLLHFLSVRWKMSSNRKKISLHYVNALSLETKSRSPHHTFAPPHVYAFAEKRANKLYLQNLFFWTVFLVGVAQKECEKVSV